MDTSRLPMPLTPLQRQIGVSSDGQPISPMALSRSTSAMSDEDISDMIMEKHLRTYKKSLKRQLRVCQDESLILEQSRIRFDNTATKHHITNQMRVNSRKIEIISAKIEAIRRLLQLF